MTTNILNNVADLSRSDRTPKAPLMGAPKLVEIIDRGMIRRSMAGSASWLKASRALDLGPGKSHRMAVYSHAGEVTWMYPNSNTGEAISAWLDLADILDRSEYRQNAIDYGRTLIEDTERGIYAGPVEEARGLMWYWTDMGTYNSLYAMRVPYHFIRLYKITGDKLFLEGCETIGNMLLTQQLPSGMVRAGWSPENGWAESGTRLGSRFVYACASFATLYKLTGEGRYREAYERAVTALLTLQCEDGSFYQSYDPFTLKRSASDSSTKCMFFAYIFNALAEAYEVFKDERLINCAKRLAEYTVELYYCRGALPYCVGSELLPSDVLEANMSMYECANGLLWLYEHVRDERFKDIGLRLWITAWYNQAEVPHNEGINGAILIGSDPLAARPKEGIPVTRKHLSNDKNRAAKCVLWGMVNHVFASNRLLKSDYIQD